MPLVPGAYVGKGAKVGVKVAKAGAKGVSVARRSLKAKRALIGVKAVKKSKMVLRVADSISDFNRASRITIGEYRHLKKAFKGAKGIEIHHIIEKRLRPALKTKMRQGEMLAVPLSKDLHKKITKRWRRRIGYGKKYNKISKGELLNACDKVYYDMPKLNEVAKNWINSVYGK